MQTEMALQKLQEARAAVDDDTAEMIDALARMVMMKQDIRSPMLGAKVTLYLRPPTEERREVDPEDAPEPNTEEWNWQWTKAYANSVTNRDEEAYFFRPKKNEDDPDLMEHKAIVFEGNVGESAPDGQLWDPNKQEYMTADDYPMGTVNCVVASNPKGDIEEDLIDFEEDYPTDVQVFTSITPAEGSPTQYEYTPGW